MCVVYAVPICIIPCIVKFLLLLFAVVDYMQNIAQSKAENLNSTIAKSAPGMVLRSQGILSKQAPITPTTASSRRSTTITSATTASRSITNSTATATSTTKPTRQKKLMFVDDSEFKVHLIDHHTTLRTEDKDYDNNFTTAADAATNSDQQVRHNEEALRRGLYIGEYYARVPETYAQEVAQACVWEAVERALRNNDLVHSLSESTTQLGNTELLEGLRASTNTIAGELGISLHRAYAMVAAKSAHLLHIGYTEAQLRAFVAKSKGTFSNAEMRAKMEHAFEAASQIVQQILAGVHILFLLQIIQCAQYIFMRDSAVCYVLLLYPHSLPVQVFILLYLSNFQNFVISSYT